MNPVNWIASARQDVLEIVDYIASDAPINAAKVLERLEARAASLNRFPERGRVTPELRHLGITSIRELIENPWRIVYEFSGSEVLIVGVLDSRRDLQSMLLERLLRLGETVPKPHRDWTLDEINAEISVSRRERGQRKRRVEKPRPK